MIYYYRLLKLILLTISFQKVCPCPRYECWFVSAYASFHICTSTFAATPLCGGRSTAATWSKGPPGSRTEGPCRSLTRWKTTWERGGEKPHLCLIRTRLSSQLHHSPGSWSCASIAKCPLRVSLHVDSGFCIGHRTYCNSFLDVRCFSWFFLIILS